MAVISPARRSTVISDWSTLSPYGIGGEAFTEGVRAGRTVVPRLNSEEWQAPSDQVCLVPGFDVVEALGSRGTRSMDRLTGITVATLGSLLEPFGSRKPLSAAPERVGLVLGTGSGSVQSTMDFTRDSLTGAKPFYVDPARFPNTVMNRAAGQSAIWYGFKGPNATLAGGPLTGLQALRYATRLRERGHCEAVLCGAVEEFSVQRAWLDWHTSEPADRGTTPLAEGCAMFLLEDADSAAQQGRRPRAEILSARFAAFHSPEDLRPTLVRCIRDALRNAGVSPTDVRLAAPSDAAGGPAGIEAEALTEAMDGTETALVRVRDLFGDASAASAALQLAAVLAVGPTGPGDGGVALVTSLDGDGLVACTVLRLL
ncbi:beta-ketoacyl synthase N-terminal-like domain-containing protein [Streptomyces sp. TX20-6-3]|uniref:beta-ketoacyl synthase N-terminal-like domain-containing protein n=1 Tax=Streptomyces sp. TX20-6-3 TaxID=3028705 RepID=UPI0029A97695|nr:beta-ketoacyl synthase N-terminal-like domain-containing protein [Streptomyces sp. TX20-6-3]MDX2561384.1 beta-ketoacyl synthase N-terminal-like domain-containing protein [Streptomyces sp. TX20-6-3]